MTFHRIALVAVSIMTAAPVWAGPASQALGTCLADNTSGRDRKELAKWIFVAMSAHPDMKDVAGVTAAARDQSNRSMGQLITRLIAESCAKEMRAAKAEGSNGLQGAFESLGRVAMQELLSNRDVTASISAFEKFADMPRIEAVMKAK